MSQRIKRLLCPLLVQEAAPSYIEDLVPYDYMMSRPRRRGPYWNERRIGPGPLVERAPRGGCLHIVAYRAHPIVTTRQVYIFVAANLQLV